VINTGTTIVTFLMAFLIGSNQLRQAARDRVHAQHDYEVNLLAKQEIEDLQRSLSRIENEKLDRILVKLIAMEKPDQAIVPQYKAGGIADLLQKVKDRLLNG